MDPQEPGTATEGPSHTGTFFNFLTGHLPDFYSLVLIYFYPHIVHFAVLDCKAGNGHTYRGPTTITILGVTCQAWSAQSPHQHTSFTPQSHPTRGLEGNVSELCENFSIVNFRSEDFQWV